MAELQTSTQPLSQQATQHNVETNGGSSHRTVIDTLNPPPKQSIDNGKKMPEDSKRKSRSRSSTKGSRRDKRRDSRSHSRGEKKSSHNHSNRNRSRQRRESPSRGHHHRSRRDDSRDRRRRRSPSDSRRHNRDRYRDDRRRDKRRSPSSSSSSSSSSSRSSSRSSSSNRRRQRKTNNDRNRKNDKNRGRNGGRGPMNGDVHPYFQKRVEVKPAASIGMEDPEAPERFWDGFQWIIRTKQQIAALHQNVTDINQNAVENATKAVTGEDAQQKEKRLAASKTVIIENIALDLGMNAREIQKFLLDQFEQAGERGIEIVDIDMNNGPTSIAVELAERSMVERIKRLDGRIKCLGESLNIRRLNEETVQTNIQSAAITLVALQNLTGGTDAQLNIKSASLKTVAPSSVIKVSNVFDREEQMTPDQFEELKEDMEDEFSKIPHLKRIRIIRNGEERLGSEVGSVFVEFRDKKSAELALKKIKGRIYDGLEIKCTFVDEKLYYTYLCQE